MLILIALGVALAVVIGGAIVRHQEIPGTSSTPGARPDLPVPSDIMHDLTAIPDRTWDAVGVAGVQPPLLAGPAHPGKATILYVGAEYCPYCAATRWSLVTALIRFGSFSGLELSTSSGTDVYPNTPTLTFLRAHYLSPSLALQTVELEGNVQQPSGGYPPLQRLTGEQEATFRRYAPRGQIPFLLVGEQYLWMGAPFSPALLQGSDWHRIASALPAGTGAAAHAILVNANEIAAAVCAVDGDVPVKVCHSPGVREAANTLPRPAPR